MTVQELREQLASMPAHLEVIVEVPSPPELFSSYDYYWTLEVKPHHEMKNGNFACIRIDNRS